MIISLILNFKVLLLRHGEYDAVCVLLHQLELVDHGEDYQ
jgi:hypothetical protein